MTAHTILWIYIILMLLGGLMGFIKAKSKASIIASTIFAVLLALFALQIIPFRFNVYLLLFLLIFFGMRYRKSKKFMPNGLMFILTILALALQFVPM